MRVLILKWTLVAGIWAFLFIDKFDLKNLSLLNKNIDIIYRNYETKANKDTLLLIKRFCQKSKRKFYISNDIKQDIQLNIDGVYIPSFNNQINYSKVNKTKSFDIIGSAHNKKEISIKKAQNCRLIFLSPLFKLMFMLLNKIPSDEVFDNPSIFKI